MPTKEQSVTLLRRNKVALAEAFNHIGFDSVSAGTRASLFPQLVKWGHGLLDVCVACRRKSDGRHFYFLLDEWLSLSTEEQNTMLMRGVRLRAHGRTVIISLFTAATCPWAGRGAIPYDVSFDLNSSDALHSKFWNARAETEFIAEFFSGQTIDNIVGSPAAEAALAYSAFSEEVDGMADDTQWAVPTMTVLWLMYRYRTELNAVIGAIGGELIRSASHWSISKLDTNSAYYMNLGPGRFGGLQKNTNNLAVRPIAIE